MAGQPDVYQQPPRPPPYVVRREEDARGSTGGISGSGPARRPSAPGAGGAKEALLPSAGCHTLVASFQLSLHVNMGGWDGYKARQTAGRAAVRRGQSHRGWQALV